MFRYIIIIIYEVPTLEYVMRSEQKESPDQCQTEVVRSQLAAFDLAQAWIWHRDISDFCVFMLILEIMG